MRRRRLPLCHRLPRGQHLHRHQRTVQHADAETRATPCDDGDATTTGETCDGAGACTPPSSDGGGGSAAAIAFPVVVALLALVVVVLLLRRRHHAPRPDPNPGLVSNPGFETREALNRDDTLRDGNQQLAALRQRRSEEAAGPRRPHQYEDIDQGPAPPVTRGPYEVPDPRQPALYEARQQASAESTMAAGGSGMPGDYDEVLPDSQGCSYTSPRGTCRNPSIPSSHFCPSHTCPVDGCATPKRSTAGTCDAHAANPDTALPPTPNAGADADYAATDPSRSNYASAALYAATDTALSPNPNAGAGVDYAHPSHSATAATASGNYHTVATYAAAMPDTEA